MSTDLIIGIFVFLAVVILIFFLLREVMCWYWKINKTIQIQQDQLKQQTEILSLLHVLVNGKVSITPGTNSNSSAKPGMFNSDILSESEMEQVKSMIPGLNDGELIVIHGDRRIIKKLHLDDYTPGEGWLIAFQIPDPEKLTESELETVKRKVSDLKDKELIVIHVDSRIIKKININEYTPGKGWIIAYLPS